MREAVDWIHLAQNSLMAASCGHFNEVSQFVNGGEYLDLLGDY